MIDIDSYEKPRPGCTMRIFYMYEQDICTIIDIDFGEEKIYIQNKTDDMLHRAFGVVEEPDWEDFEYFLLDRCFPPTRGRMKEELARWGLTSYDPLQIVEKANGRTAEDDLWMQFRYYPRTGE